MTKYSTSIWKVFHNHRCRSKLLVQQIKRLLRRRVRVEAQSWRFNRGNLRLSPLFLSTMLSTRATTLVRSLLRTPCETALNKKILAANPTRANGMTSKTNHSSIIIYKICRQNLIKRIQLAGTRGIIIRKEWIRTRVISLIAYSSVNQGKLTVLPSQMTQTCLRRVILPIPIKLIALFLRCLWPQVQGNRPTFSRIKILRKQICAWYKRSITCQIETKRFKIIDITYLCKAQLIKNSSK